MRFILYRRIIFGALVKPALQTIQDLNAREIAILAPLVVITIALGIYPKPVFDVTTPSVAKLIHDNKTALAMDHANRQGRADAEGSGPVNLQTDLLMLLPELIMAVGAMVLLLAGAIGGEKTAHVISWGAIALLVVAGVVIVMWTPDHATAFHGAFVADGFARFAKMLILIGRGALHPAGRGILRRHQLSRFELPVLMVLATLGMLLMVSASSFLSLYMGLELQTWRFMCWPPSTATICAPPKRA